MTWLLSKEKTQQQLTNEFRELVDKPEILQIPGVHDGMAALIAKQVGFEGMYLSGAALTASRGLPDLGILTSEEMAMRARDIIRATQHPLLVDIDTGYGGVINVARTAKEMVEAKVAAVQIEDQEMPKKCGHLNGKRLISTSEMMEKIDAIKRTEPGLFVVARTDALEVEGIEAVIKRGQDYIKAGADAIFPEALTTEAAFRKISQALTAPLLANMTEFGKTPYFTAKQFQSFGVNMVIYPVTSLRVAAKAYKTIFQEILQNGTQKDLLDDMQTRHELYDILSYYDYETLDQKISQTKLTD